MLTSMSVPKLSHLSAFTHCTAEGLHVVSHQIAPPDGTGVPVAVSPTSKIVDALMPVCRMGTS